MSVQSKKTQNQLFHPDPASDEPSRSRDARETCLLVANRYGVGFASSGEPSPGQVLEETEAKIVGLQSPHSVGFMSLGHPFNDLPLVTAVRAFDDHLAGKALSRLGHYREEFLHFLPSLADRVDQRANFQRLADLHTNKFFDVCVECSDDTERASNSVEQSVSLALERERAVERFCKPTESLGDLNEGALEAQYPGIIRQSVPSRQASHC